MVADQPSAGPGRVGPGTDGPVWAIVLAAGSGQRFGAAKQFLQLGGRPLLDWSVTTAAEVADGVVVVLPDPTRPWRRRDPTDSVSVVAGGASRADSVRAGLAAVPPDAQIIVVADAAHPLASRNLFAAVVAAVRAGADGAVPGLPLAEVLARVDEAGNRVDGLAREGLVLVQTPQAFRAGLLRAVHAPSPQAAEDSALVAEAGGRIAVVAGDPDNIHVTTERDLSAARRLSGAVTDR